MLSTPESVLLERSFHSIDDFWKACNDLEFITSNVRLTPGFFKLNHSKFLTPPENKLFGLTEGDYGLQVVQNSLVNSGELVPLALAGVRLLIMY